MPQEPYVNESAVVGQKWPYAKFDMGPTFGLVRRPMWPDRILTDAGDYTIQPFDFQIIVRKDVAQATTIYLPDINLWMKQPYGFWPIIIKDGGYNAATYNITVQPYADQTIDSLGAFVMIENGLSMTVRPLSDLTGWWWS